MNLAWFGAALTSALLFFAMLEVVRDVQERARRLRSARRPASRRSSPPLREPVAGLSGASAGLSRASPRQLAQHPRRRAGFYHEAPPAFDPDVAQALAVLHERLVRVAEDECVMLLPADDIRIKDHPCAGCYSVFGDGRKQIRIMRDYVGDAFVLAHELGHHFAFKRAATAVLASRLVGCPLPARAAAEQAEAASSEEAADAAGLELAMLLLDDLRREILRPVFWEWRERRDRFRAADKRSSV